MAEGDGANNTAIVAIVILVVAALLFFYLMFRGGEGDGDEVEFSIEVPEKEQGSAHLGLPELPEPRLL